MTEMTWQEYAAQAHPEHAAAIKAMQPETAVLPWHLDVPRSRSSIGVCISDTNGSTVATLNSAINSAIVVRAVNEWSECETLRARVAELERALEVRK